MSNNDNKAIARRILEDLWSEGDLNVIDEVVSDDCILHVPFPSQPIPVKGIYMQRVVVERKAFPDLHFTVEDQIAEGDKVVTRWTLNGTHQHEFMGLQPTGNKTTQMGISIFRISDGKVKEIWLLGDELGWIQQMGVRLPESFRRLDPSELRK
jgi:steroid delta-isomerase-like uncharacterized protein